MQPGSPAVHRHAVRTTRRFGHLGFKTLDHRPDAQSTRTERLSNESLLQRSDVGFTQRYGLVRHHAPTEFGCSTLLTLAKRTMPDRRCDMLRA